MSGEQSGKSLSALVADFFTILSEDRPVTESPQPPRVRSLIGAFKGSTVTEEAYRKHLVKKYR